MVAHHLKGARGVAKQASGLSGRTIFDEESPEGFILALLWRAGLEEETTACGYVMWCAYTHARTVTLFVRVVKINWHHHFDKNGFSPHHRRKRWRPRYEWPVPQHRLSEGDPQ
jgi:hypothetical protein